MAYVYKHIRLDKNEVFYVGIGKQENYKRAYTLRSRNLYWKNIVNITDYKVEIIHENISWEYACEKEKEYINLYGRKDLELGTLVNMTDGGEGFLGYKHSSITKEKMSNSRKGKKCSDELKEKLFIANKHNCKPVIQYDLEYNIVAEFNSLNQIFRKTGHSVSNISNVCNGLLDSSYGYIWKFKDDIIDKDKKIHWRHRCVSQKDMNENIINIYDSISEASKITGIPRKSISNCCFYNVNKEKDYSSAYKYKWIFVDNKNKIINNELV